MLRDRILFDNIQKTAQGVRVKPIKVLAIDDEPSITRMIKISLEAEGGFEVCEENWGPRSVEAAKRFQPHIILLDLILPDTDGIQIAEQLAADPQTSAIPVIVLTAVVEGSADVPDLQGLERYPRLSKPTTLSQIIACIHAQLDPARSSKNKAP
jgi:CheY-like chemotaxis protein